jgi:esterase/lipase
MCRKIIYFISYLSMAVAFEVRAAEFSELTAKRLDGSFLNYYTQIPDNKTQHSVLLVLQGSSCKSVYSSAKSAGGMVDNFKIVRVDIEKYALNKDTKECPKEYLSNNTIDQRVADILQVISVLRSQDWWDRKLFIVGGSEGAVLTSILPAYIPETSKVVIMNGGVGWTMREEMLFLLKKRLKNENKSAQEIDEELKIMNTTFDEAIENPTISKTYLGATNTYKWWSSILNLRPVNYMVNYNIPILLIQGSIDQAVPVESARAAEALFREMGKSNLKYVEYEGLDHSWNDANGKSQISVVLKDVFTWLFRL